MKGKSEIGLMRDRDGAAREKRRHGDGEVRQRKMICLGHP